MATHDAPQDPPSVDELLEEAQLALDAHDFVRARDLSVRALALEPDEVEALYYRAMAEHSLGEVDSALELLERAHDLEPGDLDVAYALAGVLVSDRIEEPNAAERALRIATKARRRAEKEDLPDVALDFLQLEGAAFLSMGESVRALECFDQVLERDPDDLDAQVERATALFEACRFDDAQASLEQILAREPNEPDVLHVMGLLAERRNDAALASRYLNRASELSPEAYPPPVTLGDESFDRVVEESVSKLPESVQEHLDNVLISVEPFPATEDLIDSDPPLSPTSLGMFRGVPVGDRSLQSSADHATTVILLYQRNLERSARTREELVEQIAITVMHEVGHLIGLDEDDLWERGLD